MRHGLLKFLSYFEVVTNNDRNPLFVGRAETPMENSNEELHTTTKSYLQYLRYTKRKTPSGYNTQAWRPGSPSIGLCLVSGAENTLGELPSIPIEVASNVDSPTRIQEAARTSQAGKRANLGVEPEVLIRVEDACGWRYVDFLAGLDIMFCASARASATD